MHSPWRHYLRYCFVLLLQLDMQRKQLIGNGIHNAINFYAENALLERCAPFPLSSTIYTLYFFKNRLRNPSLISRLSSGNNIRAKTRTVAHYKITTRGLMIMRMFPADGSVAIA